VRRSVLTRARNDPERYLLVVFFDSYEAAMKNNELSETAALAEAMQKLTDGPPTFYNLDVERVIED